MNESTIPHLDDARKSKNKAKSQAADSSKEKDKEGESEGSGGSKSIPFAFIENPLCDWMDGRFEIKGLKPFAHKFRTMRGGPRDQAVILEITTGETYQTCRVVSLDYVARLLKDQLKRECTFETKMFNIDLKKCKLVAETWAALHDALTQMPRSIGFKSTPELCMFRHNFDPFPMFAEDLTKNAPVFVNTLSRATNKEPLVRRMGSVFDPNASRKQIVLLYGPQDGGKSFIIDILNAMVSDDYFCTIDPSQLNKPDAVADLLGMRVGAVNENAVKFIKSEIFKTLTGGEKLRGRNLFERSFNFRPDIICFATMNPGDDSGDSLDEIPTSAPIRRRIIPVHIESIPKDQQLDEVVMKKILAKELPYIISWCYQTWKFQGRMAYIENDQTALDQAKEQATSQFDDFIDWHLALKKGSFVYNAHMQELMRNADIKSTKEQQALKNAIIAFGATLKRHTLPDGSRPNVYLDVILKTTAKRVFTGKVLPPTQVDIAPLENWPTD